MNLHPFLTTLKNTYELARGAIRLATLVDEIIIGQLYKLHAFASLLKTRKASRACVICVILLTSQRPTTQIEIAQTQIQLEDDTIKSVHIGSRKVSTRFSIVENA